MGDEAKTSGGQEPASATGAAREPTVQIENDTDKPLPACVVQPGELASTLDARFGPTTCTFRTEREGVVIEGDFDPFSGTGIHEALVKLHNQMEERAGSQPELIATEGAMLPILGADIDAHLVHGINGHIFPVETNGKPGNRCIDCGQPEWWCLDSPKNVCVPKVKNGETDEPGA